MSCTPDVSIKRGTNSNIERNFAIRLSVIGTISVIAIIGIMAGCNYYPFGQTLGNICKITGEVLAIFAVASLLYIICPKDNPSLRNHYDD